MILTLEGSHVGEGEGGAGEGLEVGELGEIDGRDGIAVGELSKVPRETHDTPINPRMTPAFSDSNFIYVFVIACHYSSNNQSLKILPWA